MKRTDLTAIEGLTSEQIDSILQLHQADVTSWNARLSSRDTTIADLQQEAKKYEGVDVEKLQKDLQDATNALSKKDRDYAVKDYLNGFKFSSSLAKKAATAEFEAQNFELKDGVFVGADEYMKKLQEEDPKSFLTDEPGSGSDAGKETDPKSGESKNIKTGLEHGGVGAGGETLSGVEKFFYEMNPDLKK